ncbi:MAG: alpha/beta fold hydrolase [Rubrivivax sp.]
MTARDDTPDTPDSADPAHPPSTCPGPGNYVPRRAAASRFEALRGLRLHLRAWGDPRQASAGRPLLVLLHGWMDVGASFQFLVDALHEAEGFERCCIAPDWRGYGLTESPAADSYWFPDYLGDLDALLDALSPDSPVDLLGHSMGGNVVMSYAGARPARVRRAINLEGFGLPHFDPEGAPGRTARWLDELRAAQSVRDFASAQEVAQRLMRNDPLLSADKAAWLATQWARPDGQGRWRILGDPAHRRINPIPYRVEEHLAHWRAIRAPLLWVEGDRSTPEQWWGGRYSKAEFHARLDQVAHTERHVVGPAGHNLHHDQPEALARLLARFLA